MSKSIYAKLAAARESFHKLELKKTGKNKYAGYDYFELGDFLIPGMKCMRENGLLPVVTFYETHAEMVIFEIDGEGTIVITSPMSEANLKGCHPIQNLGAVQTYLRRYLWVAALEIVEHDALDSTTGKDEPEPAKKAPVKKAPAKKKAAAKKAPAKKEEPDEEDLEPRAEFDDEEGAKDVADVLIGLAATHNESIKSLAVFWKKNAAVLDKLDEEYPDEFARVKKEFTKLRKSIETKEK
jgi:hypothetical protein